MENNRKLRVLCLHGWNNTSEIFRFQLQYYIETYSSVVEFVFLDGPYACSKLPLKPLAKIGFEGCKVIENNFQPSFSPKEKPFPPVPIEEVAYEDKDGTSKRYYCWMGLSDNILKYDKKAKELKIGKTRLDQTVYGNEESLQYVIDFINSQE